jgi:SanA protein
MMNYLVALGIPRSKIICDYAGFRTLDSVVRAKNVFKCTSLTIVSQKFHVERALCIAHAHGIDAMGFCAKDIKSKVNFTRVREYLARVAMFIDLCVLKTQPKFPG